MEKENKKQTKKLSAFQITAVVLIAIFTILVIIEVCVIVSLKNKTNDLSDKNEEVAIEICIFENEKTDTNMLKYIKSEEIFDSIEENR